MIEHKKRKEGRQTKSLMQENGNKPSHRLFFMFCFVLTSKEETTPSKKRTKKASSREKRATEFESSFVLYVLTILFFLMVALNRRNEKTTFGVVVVSRD